MGKYDPNRNSHISSWSETKKKRILRAELYTLQKCLRNHTSISLLSNDTMERLDRLLQYIRALQLRYFLKLDIFYNVCLIVENMKANDDTVFIVDGKPYFFYPSHVFDINFSDDDYDHNDIHIILINCLLDDLNRLIYQEQIFG